MLLKYLADNRDEGSVATRLRRRRFKILLDLIERQVGDVVRVLDVGGRVAYWEMMTSDVHLQKELQVTLLNLEPTATNSTYRSVIGDGRAMPQFPDGEFDIVYSNSTIEHAGCWEDQQRMANEIRRVGRMYCVQTPNRYFPVEPHFLFPFFQFLPTVAQTALVRRFALGWFPRVPERAAAEHLVKSIRLLSRHDVARLFPGAVIFEERFAGVVKSLVAYTPPPA